MRSRVRKLGAWDLDYDWMGTRLRSIGPYNIDYDWGGSRVRDVELDEARVQPRRADPAARHGARRGRGAARGAPHRPVPHPHQGSDGRQESGLRRETASFVARAAHQMCRRTQRSVRSVPIPLNGGRIPRDRRSRLRRHGWLSARARVTRAPGGTRRGRAHHHGKRDDRARSVAARWARGLCQCPQRHRAYISGGAHLWFAVALLFLPGVVGFMWAKLPIGLRSELLTREIACRHAIRVAATLGSGSDAGCST